MRLYPALANLLISAACSSAQPVPVSELGTAAAPAQEAPALPPGQAADINCVLTCEGSTLQTFTTPQELCNNAGGVELVNRGIITALPRCFYQIAPASN